MIAPLVLGTMLVGLAAAPKSENDHPSRESMMSQVTTISFEMMGAAARDPCDSGSREARAFYQTNAPRWAKITQALREKYDGELASQFGEVIPEGCVSLRPSTFRARRRSYEASVAKIERELGIGGER